MKPPKLLFPLASLFLLAASSGAEVPQRIVAKVDHLMSLCDALEAKLKQSQTDSDRLLAAAVHHLLEGGPTQAPAQD